MINVDEFIAYLDNALATLATRELDAPLDVRDALRVARGELVDARDALATHGAYVQAEIDLYAANDA